MKYDYGLEPFDFEQFAPPTGENKIKKPAVKLEDGSVYEGEWNIEGEPDGRGSLVTSDGSFQEGLWQAGKANGKGRLVFNMTKEKARYTKYCKCSVYVGDWHDGKKHGQGKLTDTDGTIYGKGNTVYNGDFIGDVKEGQGEQTDADGHYIGEFKDDAKHGKGVWTSDGNRYEGEWSRGFKEG